MGSSLKTASFTVHATEKQSLAWKRAAAAEGHRAAGTWLAQAADAYLAARDRAGKPLPLAWTRGRFRVALLDGSEPEMKGWLASPFGFFRGTSLGLSYEGCHRYTLTYLPSRRTLATLRSARQCKLLAGELSRMWIKWDGIGEAPTEDISPVLERHAREAV